MENKEKLDKLKFNYKVWLETEDGENILGDGKWVLLKAIDETGSLKSAMEKLGLTYRKTWDNLKKIENKLGFNLIKPIRGGCEGGYTTLTEEGKMIISIFDEFHKEYDELIYKTAKKILIEKNQPKNH